MSKFISSGIVCVIGAITSGVLEKIFYGGRVDDDNILQESFFLPLSFLLAFLGLILLAVGAIRTVNNKRRRAES